MTVNAPGAADAALTVGAVDDGDLMAYFSSRGPRLGDGALKPDVVAPGVGITAARAAGTVARHPRRRPLHLARRHVDGHASRRGPGRDPEGRAPAMGRRKAQGRDHVHDRSRRRCDRLRCRRRTRRRSAGRRGDRPGLGVAQPRLLHLAADRSADDADEADLHEHGRRGGDARPLARLAGRSRGCPGRASRSRPRRSRFRPEARLRSTCSSTRACRVPARSPAS